MKVIRPKEQALKESQELKKTLTSGVPAVLQGKGGAVALPEEWEKQLAASAKEETAMEVPTGESFSTRGGILSYNGQPLPDSQVDAIVVASCFDNSLFIGKFDPNKIVSPICFALSRDGEDMEPHENSFKKQHALWQRADGTEYLPEEGKPTPKDVKIVGYSCTGCPHADWGSDPNSPSGRGKACKEYRRLALMPVDSLDKEGIAKAMIARVNVPVTSTGNWGNYVHMLNATSKRPPWAVITRIKVAPHQKKQIEMTFELIEAINNPEALQAIQGVRERGYSLIMTPYGMMTQEQYDEIIAEQNKPQKARKF